MQTRHRVALLAVCFNPILNSVRVRRWVRRETAIGPRHKGGLRNMDWKTHVTSFWAQWIIRYMKPGEASWKQILDYFIHRIRTAS